MNAVAKGESMKEIWYKTLSFSDSITPVEVDSYTGANVMFDDRRHKRVSLYDSYFPTEKEAVLSVISRHKIALSDASTEVLRATKSIEKLNSRLQSLEEK